MMKGTCGGCNHYEEGDGTCRESSPDVVVIGQVEGRAATMTVWPVVRVDGTHWCSKFTKKGSVFTLSQP